MCWKQKPEPVQPDRCACSRKLLERSHDGVKGYIGKVEIDEEAGVLHGEVINLRDVVTFEGETVEEVQLAFRESVEDYLEFCAQRGEEPEKPFSGKFVVRLPVELHRKAYIQARLADKSLNGWVKEVIESAVQE
jgi:predicted HicB family RNase H-like nuclease